MVHFFKRVLKLFILSCCFFSSVVFATEEQQVLRAGTFFKVINLSEISTLMADIDDEVMFLNTQDMYIYETNAIPANTKVYGEVEDVLEPVQGRDGAIKIRIYKLITPDKKVYRVNGHLYSADDNYLGGRYTQAVYYRRTPHYVQGFRGMLHATPTNILEQGKHTVIMPGAELFVILEENMILKWT